MVTIELPPVCAPQVMVVFLVPITVRTTVYSVLPIPWTIRLLPVAMLSASLSSGISSLPMDGWMVVFPVEEVVEPIFLL